MTAVSTRGLALFVVVGPQTCCIPLAHVIETMRPLPVELVADMPSFVKGLSVIRGEPVPVVDLASVVGVGEAGPVSRLVSLRLGDRRVALAVDGVIGVRALVVGSLKKMPPLLRGASAETVEAIGTLDSRLLVVLSATRILAEEVWQTLEQREVAG